MTIPNSVKRIGPHAFEGCSALENITIPNSVKRIGKYAFSGCKALKSITIPNSVTSIGQSAFSECTALKSITIPNSVTSIGKNAFEKHSAIKFEGTTEQWIKISGKYPENSNCVTRDMLESQQQQQQLQQQRQQRITAGLCQHCGGTFKGLFIKKCANCGEAKDY